MPRANRVPTPAQQAASRANGALGGRLKEHSPAALRRARQRAHEMGLAAVEAAMEYLVWTMNDTTVPLPERTRCAVEVLDRCGPPRQTATIAATVDVDDVKTLELVGFPAPPGWNGPAPEPLVLVPPTGNGDGNGNGDGAP